MLKYLLPSSGCWGMLGDAPRTQMRCPLSWASQWLPHLGITAQLQRWGERGWWHGMAQYGTVWHGMARLSMVWHGMARLGTA